MDPPALIGVVSGLTMSGWFGLRRGDSMILKNSNYRSNFAVPGLPSFFFDIFQNFSGP